MVRSLQAPMKPEVRRGDAAVVGKQMCATGGISIDTEKTEMRLTIPIPELLVRSEDFG